MNSIQFTKKDIVQTLEKIIEKGPIEGKKSMARLAHEIKNYNNGIEGFTTLIMSTCEDITNYQRAYIGNIHHISDTLTQSIHNIANTVRDVISLNEQILEGNDSHDRLPSKIKILSDSISTNSEYMLEGTERIMEYSPLVPNVKKMGPLGLDDTLFVEIVDRQINNLIYCYNLQFSPDFQREEYFPAVDIKTYCDSHENNDGKVQAILHNVRTADAIIKGSENNILKNAIIPLHNNAEKHAYKGKDIYGRSLAPDFKKEIEIGSIADQVNKLIIYQVKDNGFGVSSNVKNLLLTKEGITNRDNSDDTGAGLWAVKTFVENMGGKLWFDTEMGKGTTFYFSVPYDVKTKNDVYIKESCKPQPKSLLI
jgi:signal transduction histidine kinase